MVQITYYSRIPGSKFVFHPDGESVHFTGGQGKNEFKTDNVEFQKQLDDCIISGAPTIYRTDENAPKPKTAVYSAAAVAKQTVQAALAASNTTVEEKAANLAASGGDAVINPESDKIAAAKAALEAANAAPQ